MSAPHQVALRPLAFTETAAAAALLAESAMAAGLLKECNASQAASFFAHNDSAGLRQLLASGARYLVAEANGELLGFIGIRHAAHLHHLFIASRWQNQGLGRRLLAAAPSLCQGPCLTVNAAQGAIGFYAAAGFTATAAAQEKNGLHFQAMSRWLGPKA